MAGARGEAVIQTESGEVNALYTNRALVDIEAATGNNIILHTQNLEHFETGVTEVAHILRIGMETYRRVKALGGQLIKMKHALDVIDELGYLEVANVVMPVAVKACVNPNAEDDEQEDPNV